MPTTPKALYRGQPGNTSTTLYTAPAATTTIVTHIAICNVTATDTTFSIANVPNGASETDANRFHKTSTVMPSETLYIDLAMVLETGDSLRATCSVAAALTFVISGVQVTA